MWDHRNVFILNQAYGILLGGEVATHQRFTLRLSWPRNLLPKERKSLFKYHSNEGCTEAFERQHHQRGRIKQTREKREERRKKRGTRCRGKPMSMIISCATSTVSISRPPRSSARMAPSGPRVPPSLRYSPFVYPLYFSFIRLDADCKFDQL